MTNALGATDEPLVHWRYARYRRELLKLGVEIYELSPELAREAGSFGNFGKSFGRLHAKVAVIDRRQSSSARSISTSARPGRTPRPGC